MKPIRFTSLLFGLLLLLGGAVHAQTACPPGMEEYGAGVCGYSQQEEPAPQAPQQQEPPSPPARWATRWGAIAIDVPHGVLGTATNTQNKSTAQQGAIADCHAKGGITCKLEIAYYNQCTALVVSNSGHVTTSAATVDEAVQSGMKTCTDAGYLNCHAGYTGCSLQERIQ